MDELFGVPPAEFVAARDALAKELRAAGDKEAAAEVKRLRRPSQAAWAVNQVARDHPELVDAVVEAGAAVRRAQEALLAGGDAGDLRAATAARRDAVRAATTAGVAVAGSSHRDAITATFDAAAADDDAADAVRTGRLAKELDPPSGFELLGMASAPPSSTTESDEGDEDQDQEQRVAATTARAEEARGAAEEAARRADDAEARRTALEEELAAAAAEADAAQKVATHAARAAEDAESELQRLTDS